VEFGEGGGNEFAMENPVSIGMRTGEYVDALLLNGVQHGGNGGGNPNQFALSGDDYWSEFEVHAGRYVDFVRFKSNSGIEVSGGGGRSGDDLDHIKIEFVENYHPSTVIVDGATGVFDFQYGGRTTETYSEQNLLSAQAYERITEKSTEFTFNTSAEGEYFAKFSVSTGLKTTSSTKEDVKNSLQEALKQGVKSTDTLKDDEGTFLIGDIRIMQDSDGHYWVIPIHAPQWTKLSQKDFKTSLDGLYDFTSGAVVQTGMKRRQKYGLNILSAT